tara:strand:+ start:1363 stop:2067 length:705 start_codon:yes stop_codon:yes gene_type:complete
MKNITRKPKPKSLVDGEKKWKSDLVAEIRKVKKSKAKKKPKIPDKFYNHYKQDDVLVALKGMYNGCCCYCECLIGTVCYDQIEHMRPKRKSLSEYPELTFDWDNLHLCCQKCNTSKGNKFDENEPILDPVIDPIPVHLGFHRTPNGVFCEPISDRGETTRAHADLDREDLIKRRLEVYAKTVETILEIASERKKNGTKGKHKAQTALRALRSLASGENGGLISWTLEKWKDVIE